MSAFPLFTGYNKFVCVYTWKAGKVQGVSDRLTCKKRVALLSSFLPFPSPSVSPCGYYVFL